MLGKLKLSYTLRLRIYIYDQCSPASLNYLSRTESNFNLNKKEKQMCLMHETNEREIIGTKEKPFCII